MKRFQIFLQKNTASSNTKEAFSLFEKSNFGEKTKDKIIYSLYETLFLAKEKNAEVITSNKNLNLEELSKKFSKSDKKFEEKYTVFSDLRKKGYVVKTGLKFGADFRVYEKGKKMKESHSKWVVFIDKESGKFTWHDFSAKNRVAHSTKKNLLLAIVDDEHGITYFEVKWIKP